MKRHGLPVRKDDRASKIERIIAYVKMKNLQVATHNNTNGNVEKEPSVTAETGLVEKSGIDNVSIDQKNSGFIEKNEKDLGNRATDLEQISDGTLKNEPQKYFSTEQLAVEYLDVMGKNLDADFHDEDSDFFDGLF